MSPKKSVVHQPCILIVDDCGDQGELLRHTLSRHNYSVVVVKNGKDALEQIKKEKPNLVFSDVMMPEMDGFELCRVIKKDPALTHIPVILLTALWDRNNLIRGLASGADYYFLKPWDRELILSRITEILSADPLCVEESGESDLMIEIDGEKHRINLNRAQLFRQLVSVYEIGVQEIRKNMRNQLKSGKQGSTAMPATGHSDHTVAE